MSASSKPFPAMIIRRYTSSSGSRKCTSQVATTGLLNSSPSSTIWRLMFLISSCCYGQEPFGFDHKLIVPKRLDLQIIIKVHDPRNLGFRLIFKQSPVKLSCLTGTAQNQAFPVLHQKAFRYTGTLTVIISDVTLKRAGTDSPSRHCSLPG